MTSYEAFALWYGPNGQGSGPGSAVEYTALFRNWLSVWIREHAIASVLDYGCGDWQWARLVNWPSYLGVEVVSELAWALDRQYGGAGRRFEHIDPATWEPPTVDLALCKDVMQHLPIAEVQALISKLRRCARHCLFVNDRWGLFHDNGEIARGEYRPVDLLREPFSLSGEYVFSFGHLPDRKEVFYCLGTP
jgi:hypothetical protein